MGAVRSRAEPDTMLSEGGTGMAEAVRARVHAERAPRSRCTVCALVLPTHEVTARVVAMAPSACARANVLRRFDGVGVALPCDFVPATVMP